MGLRLRKPRSEVEEGIRKQLHKGQAIAESSTPTEQDFSTWYHATWVMLGSYYAGTAQRPVSDFKLDPSWEVRWRVPSRLKHCLAALQTLLACLEFSEEPDGMVVLAELPSTASLSLPEKITPAWIWNHVSAGAIWTALGVCISALAGAFWLGYRAGLSHWLAWLLE